jgi:hypothetical protein
MIEGKGDGAVTRVGVTRKKRKGIEQKEVTVEGYTLEMEVKGCAQCMIRE